MTREAVNETGKTYHRLTVGKRVPNDKSGMVQFECHCECGNTTVVRAKHLRNGAVKSCGCWRTATRIKHGASATPMYKRWHGIIDRTTNPNHAAWKHYGGRGITICPRWRESFTAFYADMGDPPGPGYSIDREDNDGPYSPDNCRWATQSEQNYNKRRTQL